LLDEFSVKKVHKEQQKKKKVNYANDSDEVEKETNLGCRATQNIRKMIQKHFLTGFDWSLNGLRV